jgi:predicted nucleotidyltransferase
MRLKYYLEDLLGLQVDLVIKEGMKLRLKENSKKTNNEKNDNITSL